MHDGKMLPAASEVLKTVFVPEIRCPSFAWPNYLCCTNVPLFADLQRLCLQPLPPPLKKYFHFLFLFT